MSPKVILLKYLTESGLGSRRKMADAIRQGRVRVNGIIAEDFRQEINPPDDSVAIDGHKVIHGKTRTVYLMMNKPAGVITTTRDEKGRRNVRGLIPEKFKGFRLYPVGRLDKMSTGLLLLTNDGDLTYRLTHPKFEHEKEYWVALSAPLKAQAKQRLEKGIDLSDGKTYPARIKSVRNKPPFNYSIAIHEGRNRQVRRMFEALDCKVLALKRVRIGKLTLGNLKEGEVRELTKREMDCLLSNT